MSRGRAEAGPQNTQIHIAVGHLAINNSLGALVDLRNDVLLPLEELQNKRTGIADGPIDFFHNPIQQLPFSFNVTGRRNKDANASNLFAMDGF